MIKMAYLAMEGLIHCRKYENFLISIAYYKAVAENIAENAVI